ncbi:MAG: ComEA family DNA-binding protein [Phycisphaerales bacterium]|nr:MAG: ComEA family DNA-binding protein [Phycisphaerales bacterium]
MTDARRQRAPGLRILLMVMLCWLMAMAYLALVRRPVEGDAGRAAWPDMRIDLNTASVDELQVLPAIGPGLAERIVADRQEHGTFASLEDLDRVPQIGPSVIERIRSYAVVESADEGG